MSNKKYFFGWTNIKKGITEPLDPITFPYLTTENLIGFVPLILLAATNNLSDVSLVAPYKFIGAHALSVDNATTLVTELAKQALITFSAPPILVLTHSSGLYSAICTCFIAAACITAPRMSGPTDIGPRKAKVEGELKYATPATSQKN